MEHEPDVAPGLDPASARITQYMVHLGWLNDERNPPQSNSAQQFANELCERRPGITWDEEKVIPDLVQILLKHNGDPHDTDIIGTAMELMDYLLTTSYAR